MALIDESLIAFNALAGVIEPSTVVFNNVSKPCISQTLSVKRQQELQGYLIDASQQITMTTSNFAVFETMGIREKISVLTVNGDTENPLVFVTKDSHPNSAVVHLFLQATP